MYSSELFPRNYQVFRCDRNLQMTNKQTGGGTLLAVRNDINATMLDLSAIRSQVTSVDVVGAKLYLDHSKLFVFVIYIPPNTSVEDLELFFENIILLDYIHNNSVMFIGDFNIPHFVSNSNERCTQLICTFMDILSLKQHNNVLNSNNRLLDLVLTNFDCETNRDEHPLVGEDQQHPALLINILLNFEKQFSNES